MGTTWHVRELHNYCVQNTRAASYVKLNYKESLKEVTSIRKS
jgi:hypothetical protein